MSTTLPVISSISRVSREPGAAPAVELDPRAYRRGLSCVHCGLCLPACPTYTQTGNEADSPRGRIQLMLGLAEGKIDLTESVQRHLDLCLDCRGCETACPSGVVYHELIEDFRERTSATARRTLQSRFMRRMIFHVLTRPTRLKLALLPARILQQLGLYRVMRGIGLFRLLPKQLQKMEQMLPARGKLWPSRLAENWPGSGRPFAANGEPVNFFAGCIGSVIFERQNRQSVELLAACGKDVSVPRAQVCCGAIHHHNGDHDGAARLAKQNIDAFGNSSSLVVTSVAGCGAMLREYDVLLRDDAEYAGRAQQFSSRVRDISEALLELGMPTMRLGPIELDVTYHDACHLAHAQKVTAAPRTLLAKIPALKIAPLPESDMCCGAAGTYNLTQPEMATELARRKLDNIASTGMHTCVTGNVGCAMHIQSQADASGRQIRVVHPVELLHRSVFGEEA